MLLMIVIAFSLSNVVLADEITDAMATVGNNPNSAFFNNLGSKLYGIILIVGSAVALGMLAIMAIKFMTSGAEEKAQVKKNLIGYTIGLLILLCVISILGIFQNIASNINGAAGTIVTPGTPGSNANSGQSTNNGSQSSNSGISSSGKVTASEWQDYQRAQADWYLKHGTWPTPEQLGPKYEDIYNRSKWYGIEGEDSGSQSSNSGVTNNGSQSSISGGTSYENNKVTYAEWNDYLNASSDYYLKHGTWPSAEQLGSKYEEIYNRKSSYGLETEERYNNKVEINENGGITVDLTKKDIPKHVSEGDRRKIYEGIQKWKAENPGKALSVTKALGEELAELYWDMRIEDNYYKNK